MRNKLLFGLSFLGIVAGIIAAYVFGIQGKEQAPVFKPASNPYSSGIYANGIIESYQPSGENIEIYPEVAGTITRILVSEGQHVQAGTALLSIDDDVQHATVIQQEAQAESAKAQIRLARASLKSLMDTYDKQRKSYRLDPRSVSKDTLDTAYNAVEVGKANLAVAQKQYDALEKTYLTSKVLLSKYIITAPSDGNILAINTAVGSYVSPQGSYDTYTEGMDPTLVMGSMQPYGEVRSYVDEILINRLPKPSLMDAKMFIQGTNISIPLEFVREQPLVSPKVELSNQRTERVDVRVLPIIFKFVKPANVSLYPGQLVDVYIGKNDAAP